MIAYFSNSGSIHEMARILFINNTSQLAAGTSRSLLLTAEFLRPRFDLTVVLDESSGGLPVVLERQGIACRILPVRTWRYLPGLVWLIFRGNFDLVYANNFCGRAENAAWAAALTRRPFVWHIRESLSERSPTRSMRLASAIIANSQDTAQRVKFFAPGSARKVVTIPNGVSVSSSRPKHLQPRSDLRQQLGVPPDGCILINVGRICRQKNQLGALEAAAGVMQIHRETRLVFAGSFQEEDYVAALRQRAAALGLTPSVSLLGPIDDIASYLEGSDIMIHSSRKESQGRVILEAMAAGLPVVAYDVGGISDALMHGKTGFLAPFGDASALSSFLQQLISLPALRRQMGQAGVQRVREHFSVERTAREIQNVIERVLSRNGNRFHQMHGP